MKLPASVQEIADVIGRDKALYLIGQLPRVYTPDTRYTASQKTTVILYVPKRLTVHDRLVTLIGWNDANKLVRLFGGMLIHPATCADIYRPFRDQNIARLRGEGVPAKMIAEWFDITERTVRNIMAEIPPHDRPAAANDNSRTVHKKRANK